MYTASSSNGTFSILKSHILFLIVYQINFTIIYVILYILFYLFNVIELYKNSVYTICTQFASQYCVGYL